MESKLRIALIGAGTMGSYHARVVAASADAVLAYVVDPNEISGRKIAEKYSAEWCANFLGVKGSVDAVIIAAATEYHYEIAKAVLEYKIPMLIEKPITPSYDTSKELLDYADQYKVPLMCGFLERYNPAVLTAKKYIKSPKHIVTSRYSPYAPRIKTGVSWDLLVHDIDLALHFIDSNLSKSFSNLGFYNSQSIEGSEDVVETQLRFENGTIARCSASRIGQKKVREIIVFEENRMFELDLLMKNLKIYHDTNVSDLEDGMGFRQASVIEIPDLVTSNEPLTSQFDRFVEIIRDPNEASVERSSILLPHRIISDIVTQGI